MAELRIGEKVPDFTLPVSKDRKVSLSELTRNGKVVLAFYPGDFSSVCTNEWCTLRDGMKEFEKLDARVVGISGDSHFTHEAFKKANNLNFDLLSDYDHQVARLYNVYYRTF
ncbi:MAG: peroxiredoxin [Candidatus Thermoplasmatota archaeon]|nr:peroxiredoxin [Candidatus Thermoplasmatota archaeon]